MMLPFHKPRHKRLVAMLALLLSLWGMGCASTPSDAPSPREAKSRENLKKIVQAVHQYCYDKGYDDKQHGAYPANVFDKAGKPLLSWRVLLLPYLGDRGLYEEFKLDEPWDSPHNRPLIKKIPEVFVSPRFSGATMGETVYQGFSGPNALFRMEKSRPLSMGNVIDGTSNTILAVEASHPVPWTKPEDIPFEMNKAVPDFGRAYDGKPLAVMLDGSIRRLNLKTLSLTTLQSAISPNDGRPLGLDWDR